MRYIKFTAETPYAGTDLEEYEAFPNKTTDKELNAITEEKCNNNAEGYEYLIAGWGEEATEEEKDNYYANCYGSWEEVTEEEFEENA